MPPKSLFTIGHSTRELEAFIDLLAAHGIEHVIDVRRFPRSRRNPHYAREPLADALGARGIGYTWLEGLGGRRSRRAGSIHTAWKVNAFAAYADHMETAEFEDAARTALSIADRARVAFMCAEARAEQCHRRLISDWLSARGHEVRHIASASRADPHELPPFARTEDGRVIYDGGQTRLIE